MKIFPVAGKSFQNVQNCLENQNYHVLPSKVVIDEGYMVVGNHVDSVTYQKIQKGEYVDFGKLIPKDKVLAEEDNRMEMVMKNGRTFYVPVSDVANINSFAQWEQVFRVFANIYLTVHPQRSAELIEYNHIIHTISLSYAWENAYLYDKEFRIHMGNNPRRSWSIILQQAWSLRLRDKVQFQGGHGSNGNAMSSHNGSSGKSKSSDPCQRYNKGRCPFGAGCRYEHKCSYCYKFGHTILTCRKLMADKE